MLLFGILSESEIRVLKNMLGSSLHDAGSLFNLETNQVKIKTGSIYSYQLQPETNPILLSSRIEFSKGKQGDPVATLWRPSSSPAAYISAVKPSQDNYESPPKSPTPFPATSPNDKVYRASFTPSLQRSLLVSQIDQFLSNVAEDSKIVRDKSLSKIHKPDISLEQARAERASYRSSILGKSQICGQLSEQINNILIQEKPNYLPATENISHFPEADVRLVPAAPIDKLEHNVSQFEHKEAKRLFQEDIFDQVSGPAATDEKENNSLPRFGKQDAEDSDDDLERPVSSRSITRVKTLQQCRIDRNRYRKDILETW